MISLMCQTDHRSHLMYLLLTSGYNFLHLENAKICANSLQEKKKSAMNRQGQQH